MNSVAERTTDRGITAAQNYTAMMARPGDEAAAGDGLGAFGAAFILSVQMHLWADRSTVPQWLWRNQRHPRAPRTNHHLRQLDQARSFFDSRPRSRARYSIDFQRPNPSPQAWSNCGTAAAGRPFCLPPRASRAAKGGGGCLTSATAAPWQVQDGRRRLEPAAFGTNRRFNAQD